MKRSITSRYSGRKAAQEQPETQSDRGDIPGKVVLKALLKALVDV